MFKIVFAAFALRAFTVSGFPFGPPFCAREGAVGTPAVYSLHLSTATRNVTRGTMAEGGFDVMIGNTMLKANETLTIDALKDYAVVIKSASGREFRGAYVLLAAANDSNVTTDSLLPQAPYQKTPTCNGTGLAGVSHMEASLKSNVSALMRLNKAHAILTLDVNIVVSNLNVTGSVYYHSQYKLAAIAAPTAPVAVVAPVAAPVAAPIVAVVPTPVAAPVAVVPTPVAIVPTPVATKAPVAAPVAAPIAAPTETCGLFQLGIFCPVTRCGLIGRLLKLCKE